MAEIFVTDVHEEGPARELRARLIAFNCDAIGYDNGISLNCFVRGTGSNSGRRRYRQ